LASAGDPAYYYLLKELYSVAGLTDNTGTMVEAYAYDAYGKVTPYSVQMVNCNVTGDADDDCDVDLADFDLFQLCYHPTGGIPAGCPSAIEAKLDLDDDNDVDLTDLAAFASAGTGPTGDFLATGDWDDSGTVDTTDAEAFVSTCYSGAGTSISSNGCRVFDFDGDGDVDIGDYGALLSLLGTSASTTNEFQLTAIDRSTKNPYFFTGRRLDWIDYGGTELNQHYNYRARDYDGERFLQRDPLGVALRPFEFGSKGLHVRPLNKTRRVELQYSDGLSLYQFVRSRSTILRDPLGLQTPTPSGFGIEAVQKLGIKSQACCQYDKRESVAQGPLRGPEVTTSKHQRTEACLGYFADPKSCCRCPAGKSRGQMIQRKWKLTGAEWGPCCWCTIYFSRPSSASVETNWLLDVTGGYGLHAIVSMTCTDGTKLVAGHAQSGGLNYFTTDGDGPNLDTHGEGSGFPPSGSPIVIRKYVVDCKTGKKVLSKVKSLDNPSLEYDGWHDCYWFARQACAPADGGRTEMEPSSR
jgi:hypothetical protein